MYWISLFCYSTKSLCNIRIKFTSIITCLLFFLSNSSVKVIQFASTQETGGNPSLTERFWEIGCEFSGVVTRVRRSAAPNPVPEEPNFDDPEELFKYLYPLADVKPDESSEGFESQRSNHGTHSLSSWLEDLLELWHSECHHRRNKRSAKRMKDREASTEPRRRFHGMLGDRYKQKLEADAERRNSSVGMFSKRKDGVNVTNNDDGDDIEGYTYVLPSQNDQNNGTESEKDPNDSFRGDKIEGLVGALVDKLPDKLVDKLPDKGEAPAGPGGEKPVQPAEKEDIFFSQYGGDIEYFFPLLSFGIPFDGEITLLGFHGFRGIFPY